MTRTSLRLRLLLGAAVAIFAALALGWAGISLLIHDYIERREAAQLTALAEQVVAGLSIDGAGRPIVDPAPADPAFPSLASGVYRSEEHTSELPSLMRISYAVFCLK